MIADATYPPYVLCYQAETGYGPDAGRLKEELAVVEKAFEKSVFFAGNSQVALAELGALALRSNVEDWDGEGGSAISVSSLQHAARFLRRMPRNWEAPEVDLDSDGDVALHWYWSPGRRLTVSVGASGVLSYAWMVPNEDGGFERNYGVAEFQGMVPTTISDFVSKIGE